jgi:hypothetical protein
MALVAALIEPLLVKNPLLYLNPKFTSWLGFKLTESFSALLIIRLDGTSNSIFAL